MAKISGYVRNKNAERDEKIKYAWDGDPTHPNVSPVREKVQVVDIGRGYTIEYKQSGAPSWTTYQNGKVFGTVEHARKTAVNMLS